MRYFYTHSVLNEVHAFPERLSPGQQTNGRLIYIAGYNPEGVGGCGHANVIKHTNFFVDPDGVQTGEGLEYYANGDWYWEEDHEQLDEGGDHPDQSWSHGFGELNATLGIQATQVGPPQDNSNPESPEHDFPQRYRETYVLAHDTKGFLGPHPGVVFIFGSAGVGKTHRVVCSPIGTIDKNLEIPYDAFKIIKGIPSNKFINSDSGNVIYYSRIAERQWRRGVCDSTFTAHNISKTDKERIKTALKGTAYSIKSAENTKNPMLYLSGSGDYSFSMKNMMKLFQPNYVGYFEAFESIVTGKRYSTAFCEQMYLTSSPKSKNLLLGIGGVEMAEVDISNPNSIIVKEPLLYQEILDLVKRQALTNVKVTKA